MAVGENVERVYPTRLELEQESQTNVPCPVVGCSKIFQQTSALRFHLVKLHRLISNDIYTGLEQRVEPQSKKKYAFYCPESSCQFSRHGQKFFQSYKKLKQHFMRLHVQRLLACSLCGKKFGLRYDLTYHVNSCRKKPWCGSCGLCMGSWESLAQHLRETGHKGSSSQHSADIEKTLDNRAVEMFDAMSAVEFSEGTFVGEAATVSRPVTLYDGSCDAETRLMEKRKEADEITDIVPSRELEAIVPSDLPVCRKSDSTADQSIHKAVISKSKDIGPITRRKMNSFGKSNRDTTPRTILPAPNFVVFPSPAMTLFLCAVPTHQSKPKLKRLAPRQSLKLLELDQPNMSRMSPVTDECLATDGRKHDMWTECSTSDSKSLDAAQESVSASTQTRGRRIRDVETQTAEGFVVKKSLSRQSCASQVSPRARIKRQSVQSTQTQTSRSLARKHKPSVSMQTVVSSAAVKQSLPSASVWPDFVHNETQTMALLQQLQESLAESSSTQTLESYLFDNFPNESCINAPSDDACATTNILPDVDYTTMTAERSNLFDTVALPIAEEPPRRVTTCGNISNTNDSDYSLFSSEFPNIVEGEQGRSFLIHDEMFVESNVRSSASVAQSSTTGCGDDLLTEQQKTFSAETQTMHPDCLTDFLTAASQTTDFDDMMSINTETQTVDDDFFTRFWSHMETQTTEEFLTEFGFSDIETQTTSVFGEDVIALGVAPGAPQQEQQNTAALLDMETQTYFQ